MVSIDIGLGDVIEIPPNYFGLCEGAEEKEYL